MENQTNGLQPSLETSDQPPVGSRLSDDNEVRVGGQRRGQVQVADDFDSLPDDIAAAFGMIGPMAVA